MSERFPDNWTLTWELKQSIRGRKIGSMRRKKHTTHTVAHFVSVSRVLLLESSKGEFLLLTMGRLSAGISKRKQYGGIREQRKVEVWRGQKNCSKNVDAGGMVNRKVAGVV